MMIRELAHPDPDMARVRGVLTCLWIAALGFYWFWRERQRAKHVEKLKRDLDLYYFMLMKGHDMPHLRREVDAELENYYAAHPAERPVQDRVVPSVRQEL